MNASDLLAELTRRGIRLQAHGDRLRYSPRSALTPDLLNVLQAHKAHLLDLLAERGTPPDDAAGIWEAALAELEGDPLWPADLLAELRAAAVRWSDAPETDRTESALTNATAAE